MSKQKDLQEILAGWNGFERPDDGRKFQHYKGGKYEVIATGYLEDTEAPCVIYRSLDKDIVWVRTAKNFFEDIEYKGETRPRFRLENT
jgi:hypothetical protein